MFFFITTFLYILVLFVAKWKYHYLNLIPYFQAPATPTHSELGINPLACRDPGCGGRLFSTVRSRARHERDAHRIGIQPTRRNILTNRVTSDSDSDSRDSRQVSPAPTTPPAPQLLPTPPANLNPLSPVTSQASSPTVTPPLMSQASLSRATPPLTMSTSSPGSSSDGSGDGRVYTCDLCLNTFISLRYYQRHCNNCR